MKTKAKQDESRKKNRIKPETKQNEKKARNNRNKAR